MLYITEIDSNSFGFGTSLGTTSVSFPKRYHATTIDPLKDGVGFVSIRDVDSGASILSLEKPTEIIADGQSFATGESLAEYLNGILGAKSNPFMPETIAYIQRVEADGGIVYSKEQLNDDIVAIKEIDEMNSLKLLISMNGGIKIGSNTNGFIEVTKVYDASGNEADAAKVNEGPYLSEFSSASIFLDFSSDSVIRKLVHTALSANNYTCIYVIQHLGQTITSYFHAGNIPSGNIGFASSGFLSGGTGPFSYNNTDLRVVDEPVNPQTIRTLTFNPSSIRINGVNQTYLDGAADVNGGGLSTIGGRSDQDTNNFNGRLAFIAVFDKILEAEKIDAIENYVNKFTLPVPLATYNELNYTILHSTGGKIFAKRPLDDKLIYSADGVNFIEYSFANVDRVQIGYIFQNGNLFFAHSTKVFYIDDNFTTLNEITPLDQDGNTYVPVFGKLNFSASHRLESQVSGSDEVLVWGNYTTDTETPIAVFYSKNGTTCKMAQRFGSTYTYNIRHTHSCVFDENSDDWYIATGDFDVNSEVALFKATYDFASDSWNFIKILQGTETDQSKMLGLQFIGNDLYWMSDQTTGTDKLGAWKCPITTVGTKGNHSRMLKHNEESAALYVDERYFIIGTISNTVRDWDVFIHDRLTGVTRQFFLDLSIERPLPAQKYSKVVGKIIKVGDNEFTYDVIDLGKGYIYNTVNFSI